MTGGERLAKVAEVLADVDGEYGTNEARAAWVVYFQRHAQALKPLVTEWQAEDEARGAGRVREAVEAAIGRLLDPQWDGPVVDGLRAALADGEGGE